VLRRFPVQRPTRVPFSALVDALVPRLAPRAHSHDVASCGRSRPETKAGHRRARGRSMRVRPGKIAFHGATLTLATRSMRHVRRNSSARGTERIPLTSLSPPPSWRLSNGVAVDARARRPPRPVPRGPRERRALPRSEMPSIVRSFAATARAEARTDRGAFVHIRRSRDEDCRTQTNRPPFASCGPHACACGVSPLVARLPSTRALSRPSFRLVRYKHARFSEPEDDLPTSAIRRCTGTGCGASNPRPR